MPIQVTCPGCMSRFAVSDKYAGKKGPCPKCKKEITIPNKTEEVVIHAPEVSGPKDSKGVSVLKPISRREFKVGKLTWIVVGVAVAAVLGTAISVRVSGTEVSTVLLVLGALVLAPPIAMVGYTFLRDDDLEGYEGREYWTRVAICSVVFAATWLVYFGLSRYFGSATLGEIPVTQMAIFVAIMIGIGLAASLLSLELEVGQAALHYLGYFAITFLLCMLIGVPLGEPLGGKPKGNGIPEGVVPINPNDAIR